MAWASGRHVRRSVKSSAILPDLVGGSSTFRRGTFSLPASRWGKWDTQERGARWTSVSASVDSKGLTATTIFLQIQPHWLALRTLTKEPGHLLRLA